jgi:lipopolysaccharide export system protein LptA
MLPALILAAALLAPTDPSPKADRPPVRIQADEVDYRLREGRTVMTGNPFVTLTRGDVVLTCRQLVLEGDGKDRIRRATCEGDVRLTRGTRLVTCATAVYDDEAARLVCKGNPTLHDGPSEMTGEELTYDLDEDRVRLTKGTGTLREPPGRTLAPRHEGKR